MRLRTIFFPSLSPWEIRNLAMLTALGALIAWMYGALHDQVSYTISPEYFTRMKFYQFGYANFGFPPRVFVAEIGFLASWWIGLVASWFVSRAALLGGGAQGLLRRSMTVFFIVIAAAVLGASLGAMRYLVFGDTTDWHSAALGLGVRDVSHFVMVGYIHDGSYPGAGIGSVIATCHLIYKRKSDPGITKQCTVCLSDPGP